MQMLLRAVNGLPPKCRDVFVLRMIEGLSQREIAERLGITVSTVEKHLARGLRHCKDSLAAQQADGAPGGEAPQDAVERTGS